MSSVCHVQGKTWGVFPWFAEDGLDEIHPDDHKLTSPNPFYGHLFRILYSDDEYLAIEGAYGMFRVKPRLFRQVQSAQFSFGDAVQTTLSNSPKVGSIKEIRWHHKQQREFYFIEVGGKTVSKRYWAEDLVAVEK
jgi:hypothetical protein